MNRVAASTVCVLGLVVLHALPPAVARQAAPQRPAATAAQSAADAPRPIRRDVPLTGSIRRAFESRTRDRTGRPGPNYWQLQTDYAITVRLDPASQTLTGTEQITLHNNSPDALNMVMLRLDHNIFRPLAPRAPGWVPAEVTEGMVVSRITVNGETVSLSGTPSGGRGGGAPGLVAMGLDQTLAQIRLPNPIAPKTTARLEIDWRTKLPGGPGQGHRTTQRWDDSLFQPTQWYPRIAKYDDLRGWDTNVYLGPSEFYNNFGRFDVRIDVPEGWIVSGTGVLQNAKAVLTAAATDRLTRVLESDEVITIVGVDEVKTAHIGAPPTPGNRLTWHFVADMVNDFAWATSKNYVWRATRATIPGKGPVPIHMVHLPEREKLFANAGPITRHALEFYSKLWAPYPFPQLTLQDGPSSGMEYPMVINSNQGAADHEAAHQWWPMMVGTNETRYGWMDEGFNQYMNILSRADTQGVEPSLNQRGQSYGNMSGNEDEAPLMWNANYGGPGYSFQTYSKTPLMLSMLGGIVGDEAVQRAMSEYTKAWSFKHPSPWDYLFFMNDALKQDLGWFWYSWLWTTDSVDGSIENVTTSGPRTTVRVRQDGQMPSPVVLRVQFAPEGAPIAPMKNARMTDAVTATVTWPVDVWFNGSRTFDAVLDFGPRPIQTITLDPACRFPDRNPGDNVWPKTAGGKPSCTG